MPKKSDTDTTGLVRMLVRMLAASNLRKSMEQQIMSDTTTTTPLTHAQRGALGGAARHPAKGFGTPDVIARAVATRRRKASERLEMVVTGVREMTAAGKFQDVPPPRYP